MIRLTRAVYEGWHFTSDELEQIKKDIDNVKKGGEK